MYSLQQRIRPSTLQPEPRDDSTRGSASLPTWRLNVMRVGYLVMGAGLALTKWPELFGRGPWELKEGTVLTMLFSMSVLALLGLRYPQRMLPILLFEVGWKLTWLAVVALPLWIDGNLTGATREQAATVLLVAIVIAVIPWRHVASQFVTASGDRWR
jgi:hypothetical protein